GPGPRFLDAPGQPVGMVAAIVGAGGTVNAGYLTSTGSRSAVTDIAEAQLRAIAPDRTPVTRELDGLGRYRLVAASAKHGNDVIVTGLPMSNVDSTLIR